MTTRNMGVLLVASVIIGLVAREEPASQHFEFIRALTNRERR